MHLSSKNECEIRKKKIQNNEWVNFVDGMKFFRTKFKEEIISSFKIKDGGNIVPYYGTMPSTSVGN